MITLRPIALKGHERAITCIKINRDGDLLFTASKDNKPCVWYLEDGERIGTYRGHNGAVWSIDVNFDSTRLLTGSADNTVKLWDVETGTELYSFVHRAPVRSVSFATGDRLFLCATDQVMGHLPRLLVYRLTDDLRQQPDSPVMEVQLPKSEGTGKDKEGYAKITQAAWGPLNQTIITSNEDGSLRVYDTETGKLIKEAKEHKKSITSFNFSKDGTHFITASMDSTAKLWDTRTLACLKTYEAEKQVNAAAISPAAPHVILGGGQAAAEVTTTHTRTGHFQVRFYHKIFCEELGSVKGHFGPVHALDFSPDGKTFCSGAEDGYVRIHHLSEEYFRFVEKEERTRPDPAAAVKAD